MTAYEIAAWILVKLEWAILFGSRARGTERPDSDVDIAISTTQPLSPADEDALWSGGPLPRNR